MPKTTPTQAYLVMVTVGGFGGHEVVSVDAFPAESAEKAIHAAENIFFRNPTGQAIVFGDTMFYPDAITSVETKVLGIVDLEHPDNLNWKRSVQLFEDFLEKMEEYVEE